MAKRMKLISEADFNRLSQLKNSITPNVEKSALEKKSHDVHLLLKAHSIPDDIKLAMYTGLMSSIGDHIKSILETPVLVKTVDGNQFPRETHKDESVESSDPDYSAETTNSSTSSSSSSLHLTGSDNLLLHKLPLKCRKKAGDVMLCLKQHPELIDWNKSGDVSFFGQQFENDISIVDLLSYLCHDLKWDVAPCGTNRFLLCVKRINVPLSLMTSEMRKRMSKDFERMNDIPSAGDSPNYFMQMKSRLRDWVSIKDTSPIQFRPVDTSTPKH